MIIQVKEGRINTWYDSLVGQCFEVVEVLQATPVVSFDSTPIRVFLVVGTGDVIHPCDCLELSPACIDSAIDAWNGMTKQQRSVVLEAASTACPADAMRHFGHVC